MMECKCKIKHGDGVNAMIDEEWIEPCSLCKAAPDMLEVCIDAQALLANVERLHYKDYDGVDYSVAEIETRLAEVINQADKK